MADIGSIEDYLNPDDWTEADPPNVLVLPQALPAVAPIVAIGPQNTAWLYSDGACAGGTCDILFHDANTGWWFLQAGVSCDGVIDAEGDDIDVETFAAGLADGINLETGSPFTPNCSLPAWAKPANFTGECNFDCYTIACDDSLIEVQIELGSDYTTQPAYPIPTPPPTPPSQACCTSYSFWGSGCCLK